jgi:hypothetical protein
MKVFMIPTGDDPEQDESVDERNEPVKEQPKKQQEKEAPAALKAKYEAIKGSLEGFEDFYKKQREHGHTDKQIEQWLTAKLQEKQQAS